MNRPEFDKWFDYHRGNFPGIEKWLEKMTSQVQVVQLDAWYRILLHIKPEEAHAATEQLFANADEAPRWYERHPQAVAAIARKSRVNRPQFVNGEQAYKCLLCEDDGRVVIWVDKKLGYTCCAACTCEAGDYWATRSKPRMIRYDHMTMKLYWS